MDCHSLRFFSFQVFVELEELRVGETGEEMEWREMARWIKVSSRLWRTLNGQ
jgi:hypothetical protein